MSKADELKAKNENLFECNTILLNENKRLKKENAELRNNGFTVSAMTEQQLKVALEKGEQLEKENAGLDMKRKAERQIFQGIVEKKNEQLTKAKEIIKGMYKYLIPNFQWNKKERAEIVELMKRAEQFLKEIEK